MTLANQPTSQDASHKLLYEAREHSQGQLHDAIHTAREMAQKAFWDESQHRYVTWINPNAL